MIVSYHNHTRWSDGTCSVADQVDEAGRLGLHEVGISDHYVLAPHGQPVEWSMDLARLPDYVAEVRSAAYESNDVVVRLGIEADFFPETVEELDGILREHPFDYVIGSVHSVDGFPIDSYARDWQALSQSEVDDVWRLYWTRIRQMAESKVFDFAAHLDLPKKFGYRPSIDLTAEWSAALDAIALADMAIEINTAGWSLPAKEPYPAPDILLAARQRNIPLLINADAHTPKVLTRDFGRARVFATECGYTELSRYEFRRRFPIPL